MTRFALAVFMVAAAACGMESPSATSSALSFASAAASGNATRCVFNTRLAPENEVRPEGTDDPVDSTASGHAQVKIRHDGTLEYKVFLLNLARETFVAGHVHRAAAGVNGPVVVPLFGGSTDEAQFVQHAEVGIEAPLADEICGDPSGFYVNYHTSADPGGAVRGQLR